MVHKPGQKPSTGSSASGKTRKPPKQDQQRTPQERVLHMGPSGKKTLIWRDWA